MAEIDIDHELAVVDRRVQQASQRAAAEVARVGRISGRATSPDGSISVEVAPGGMLTDLQLSPAALQVDMETLARRIVSVADRATRLAGGNMHQALAPVVGEKHMESLGYVPVEDDQADADPEVDFSDPLKQRGHRP